MHDTTVKSAIRAVLLAASLALAGQIAWDAWQFHENAEIGPACVVPESG